MMPIGGCSSTTGSIEFSVGRKSALSQNLTLHNKRVMYILEPSEDARAVGGKSVLVRELEDGEVVIEHKGVALPARAFVKDARVRQGELVENKVLTAALADIQRQQQERDVRILESKRMTLREEDLYRQSVGEADLAERRRRGRPTIKEAALARLAAEQRSTAPTVDRILAQTLERLTTSRA